MLATEMETESCVDTKRMEDALTTNEELGPLATVHTTGKLNSTLNFHTF